MLYKIPLYLFLLYLIPDLRYNWFRYTQFRYNWFHFGLLYLIPLYQVPCTRGNVSCLRRVAGKNTTGRSRCWATGRIFSCNAPKTDSWDRETAGRPAEAPLQGQQQQLHVQPICS